MDTALNTSYGGLGHRGWVDSCGGLRHRDCMEYLMWLARVQRLGRMEG